MTMISPATRQRAPLPAAFFFLSLSGPGALFGGIASAARRWRSFRALQQLEAMPDHILKDIGWPATGTDRH